MFNLVPSPFQKLGMTHQRVLRVTVVGAAGKQGRRRKDAVLQTPGLSLAQLVDIPEVAGDLRHLAQEVDCPYATDWEQAVAHPDTDIVLICTPNHLHAEMAITALAHGKHVLVEKPLANTLEDAMKIVAEAQSAKRFLKTGLNYRYREPITRALEHLNSGVIGSLLHINGRIGRCVFLDPEGRRSWTCDAALGGRGALLDLGIHLLDIARIALAIDQDEFCSVTACIPVGRMLPQSVPSLRNGPDQIDEQGSAIFRSRKGRHFLLHASWVETRKFLGAWIEFIGENGRIEADLTTRTTKVVLRRNGLVQEATTSFEATALDPSWIAELVVLRDSILRNEPLEGDGEDGLAAQSLVFAAYASAQAAGFPVDIDSVRVGSNCKAYLPADTPAE